jgi:hypothetical protein
MLVFRIGVDPSERLGATDANCTRITCIDSLDALGYRGCGREEHSGENAPQPGDDLVAEIADNGVGQVMAEVDLAGVD